MTGRENVDAAGMSRRRFVVGLGALAAGLGLAACSTPTAGAPTAPPGTAAPAGVPSPGAASSVGPVQFLLPSPSAAPSPSSVAPVVTTRTSVQVAYTSTSAANSAVWSAADGGYFDKYGLDVDVQNVATSPQAVAAMLSGQLAVNGGIAGTQMVAANLKGGDTVLLAATIPTFPNAVNVQPEITSADQLRGKKIAIVQFGTATDTGMRLYLKQVGLDPDTDATLLQSGGLDQSVAGLQTKAFDAAILSPPYIQIAINAGFPSLQDLGQLGIPYVYNGLGTTQSFLGQNRALLTNVLKAMIEGVHRFKTDEDFGKGVIAHWTQNNDPNVLQATWSPFAQSYLQDRPFITDAAIQTVLGEIASSTPDSGAASADPKSFYDMSLLNELDQQGFFSSLGITS